MIAPASYRAADTCILQSCSGYLFSALGPSEGSPELDMPGFGIARVPLEARCHTRAGLVRSSMRHDDDEAKQKQGEEDPWNHHLILSCRPNSYDIRLSIQAPLLSCLLRSSLCFVLEWEHRQECHLRGDVA